MSDIFFATSETALKPARKIPTTADNCSATRLSCTSTSMSHFLKEKVVSKNIDYAILTSDVYFI